MLRHLVLGLALFPVVGHGQESDARPAVSAEAVVSVGLRALGVEASFPVNPALVITAGARHLEAYPTCIESTPTPCDPSGAGVAAGLRLSTRRGSGWGVYIEADGGVHRYSTGDDTRPLFGLGGGAEWSLGARGSLRLGLRWERVQAGPPLLPEWRDPGAHHAHHVVGIAVGAGVGIG